MIGLSAFYRLKVIANIWNEVAENNNTDWTSLENPSDVIGRLKLISTVPSIQGLDFNALNLKLFMYSSFDWGKTDFSQTNQFQQLA